MDGHSAGGLAGLWSRLAHVHLRAPIDAHGFVSHLHDVGLSALAAAIIMLGVVILLELRSVARMRQVMDRSLERVFEQLDLLRFETQQLEEQWQSKLVGVVSNVPESRPAAAREPVAAPKPAATAPATLTAAIAPVAINAPLRELAEPRSLSSGEARLLSSLAEARARRAAAAQAARA